DSPVESGSSRKVIIVAAAGCIVLVLCCIGAAIAAAAFSSQIASELGKTDIEVTDTTADDNGTPTPSPTPEAGAVNNPYKNTQQVKIENVSWKIDSANDLGGRIKADAQFLSDCVAEGSKFIKVVFTVTNGTDRSVSLYDIELADPENRRFSEY